MSRLPILAALCLTALPAAALAQPAPAQPAPAPAPAAPPAPAGPPPEALAPIQQAGMAFGQCVQAGVQAVPATVTPEAGATSVLGGCAPQRQALEQAVNALLATLPAEQRAAGQERLRSELGGIQGQVAAAIQARRTPAPAPAAPAPTPAPAPAPTPGH
jgi:pyruvate dehydrogenase E2 component (dihydrolipoamide acetyltransferase)